ncbi:hypothetical protein EBB07_28740 [Paenibacillaceae bacterium]|nr:hypothetical protein EBB07_28740 [Paenibacillaceae bacterium]
MTECGTCLDDIVIVDDLLGYHLIIETSEWDNYSDGLKKVYLPINYCPMCGIRFSQGEKIDVN